MLRSAISNEGRKIMATENQELGAALAALNGFSDDDLIAHGPAMIGDLVRLHGAYRRISGPVQNAFERLKFLAPVETLKTAAQVLGDLHAAGNLGTTAGEYLQNQFVTLFNDATAYSRSRTLTATAEVGSALPPQRKLREEFASSVIILAEFENENPLASDGYGPGSDHPPVGMAEFLAAPLSAAAVACPQGSGWEAHAAECFANVTRRVAQTDKAAALENARRVAQLTSPDPDGPVNKAALRLSQELAPKAA